MGTRDRSVDGVIGDYASQPAEEVYYMPPSSWTPINLPRTPSSPLQNPSQVTQLQTPTPLPTGTSPALPRGRKRAKKTNLNASIQKHDAVAETKPLKKKARSSTNKRPPKSQDASENFPATKTNGAADQSHFLFDTDPNTPLYAASNTGNLHFECNASADMSGSISTTESRTQTGSMAPLSAVGFVNDDYHASQRVLRTGHPSVPVQTAKPNIDSTVHASTNLDSEDNRSDTIDNCAEYDEIFHSLLDDTANSSATLSGSRTSSNSTYRSSSVCFTQDVKAEHSDLEDGFHIFSSPSVARQEVDRKPIVRSPFPSPVSNRSPIIGLSPSLLLRTCFRIGEAINQACHATKNRQKVIFELYARIMSSRRDSDKQDFLFCDLFHEKPPYLRGIYSATIWKHVDLYNYDSRRLLTEKRMCRCVGEIKRDGKEWVLTVSNIWEATWEDIDWVEGIINAE